MTQEAEKSAPVVLDGISAKLLQDICTAFRERGSWPKYTEFEIRYRRTGPLEVALQPLCPEFVQVWGSHDSKELRLASLAAYRLCEGSSDDVQRFVETARLFARKYIESAGQEEVQVRGTELQRQFHLDDAESLRLCRLVDDFGQVLENGGGRGEAIGTWYFTVNPRAMYFEDVESPEQFAAKKEWVSSLEELQVQRSRGLWSNHEISEAQPQAPRYVSPTDFPEVKWGLHPAVAQAAGKLFASGCYSEAVRAAMQRFEYYLQDRLKDFDSVGRRLVSNALNVKSPAIRLNACATSQERDEQEGYFHLATGAFLAFRNVHSHGRVIDLTAEQALEQLAVVSALIRRVDTVPADEGASLGT